MLSEKNRALVERFAQSSSTTVSGLYAITDAELDMLMNAARQDEAKAASVEVIRDGDAVCTTCRWKGAHSPRCPLNDEAWPMIEVPAHQDPRERIAALEAKAGLFDAIMANVPDAYKIDGHRVLTGPEATKRPIDDGAGHDAAWTITSARDAYRALTKSQQEA